MCSVCAYVCVCGVEVCEREREREIGDNVGVWVATILNQTVSQPPKFDVNYIDYTGIILLAVD